MARKPALRSPRTSRTRDPRFGIAGASGFELLGEWRASPRTADIPVFILTSKDLSPEEQRFLRANAQSLLLKQQPWQEALIKQLSRVVSMGPAEIV